MSVYSMTGYAHAQSTAPESTDRAAVNVELRSVNGRFLDLSFRLPDELRSLEPALRDLLGAAFRRGKIELRLTTAREAEAGWPQPTPEQLNRLGRLEGQVRGWLSDARPLSVNEVLLWCRAPPPRSGWTRWRCKPRATACKACATRASAKARAWWRC